MISIRTASGVKQVDLFVRTSSGLKTIGEAYIRTAAGLKQIFNQSGGALSVAVPPTAYGAAAQGSSVNVTTESVTAFVSGGVGPYSYLWGRTDGGGGTWIITAPTSETTAFRANSVAPLDSLLAQFKVTVTDSLGATILSAAIDATADNFGV